MNYLPIAFVTLLSSGAVAAPAVVEPEKLTCKSYGNIFFVPNASGSKFDVLEEQAGVPSDGDTISVDLKRHTLEYTLDGELNREALKQVAPRVYLASGVDESGDYYGTYTFSADFVLANYSSEGDYFESFVCETDTPLDMAQ